MSAASPLDLLGQARHLATKDLGTPEQASLRRAVSTSYYAVFHLLVGEATASFGDGDDKLKGLMARAFAHTEMAHACATFATAGSKPALITALYGTLKVPAELQRVAQAFIDLQHARQDADYGTHREWGRTEALTEVERAEEAFKDWNLIRPSGAGDGGPGSPRSLTGEERDAVRLFLAWLILSKRIQGR